MRGGLCRRSIGEKGSVLLLFPAAFLIVVTLAAITVDTSIAFLGQRELAEATSAAANDAAADALALSAFYQNDLIALDGARAEAVAVDRIIRMIDASRHSDLRVTVSLSNAPLQGCPPRVEVVASSTVSYVFARALPGGPDTASVSARATASPRQDATSGC